MKNIDFLISGDVAGFDIMYAQALQRRGCNTVVTRHISKKGLSKNLPLQYEYDENRLVFFENSLDWVKLARNSRMVISLSGSAMFNLQPILWYLRNILGIPPVIHLSTGSDMLELLIEKSGRGDRFREYLKWVKIVGMCNYPKALINAQNIGLENQVFFYYPYYIDTKFDSRRNTGKIKFFHPANLDWKVSNSDSNRASGKGNDLFIRAFSRALVNGLDAECIMLFRGPDRENALELVKTLGIEDRIIWFPEMPREEYLKTMSEVDVVVDQFEVGAAGGVFMEALSLGKSVLSYINPVAYRLIYPELPPMLNCRTEDEIYQQLLKCSDREFLCNLGAQGKIWVNRYHSLENSTNLLLYYFSVFSGRKIFDFE
jgi:glycosyltransferase involved in cell wall biosynthesis